MAFSKIMHSKSSIFLQILLLNLSLQLYNCIIYMYILYIGTNIIFSVYSSANGYLGEFQFFAMMNKAAISM